MAKRIWSDGTSAVKQSVHFEVRNPQSRSGHRSPGCREGLACPQWSDRLTLHLLHMHR